MESNPETPPVDVIQTVEDLFRESDERVMAIFNKIWELVHEC
jgi:uncharacterized membrane protein